jgi:hypothetical protein
VIFDIPNKLSSINIIIVIRSQMTKRKQKAPKKPDIPRQCNICYEWLMNDNCYYLHKSRDHPNYEYNLE